MLARYIRTGILPMLKFIYRSVFLRWLFMATPHAAASAKYIKLSVRCIIFAQMDRKCLRRTRVVTCAIGHGRRKQRRAAARQFSDHAAQRGAAKLGVPCSASWRGAESTAGAASPRGACSWATSSNSAAAPQRATARPPTQNLID